MFETNNDFICFCNKFNIKKKLKYDYLTFNQQTLRISETAKELKIRTCFLTEIPYEQRMQIDLMIDSIIYIQNSNSFCSLIEHIGNVYLGTSVIKDMNINKEENKIKINYEKEIKIYENDNYYFLPVLIQDKGFIIMKIKKEDLLIPNCIVEIYENPLQINPLEYVYNNGKIGIYNFNEMTDINDITNVIRY